MLKILKTRYV